MKVTVDNLESASEQDVFNQTARHLLTQNERGVYGDGLDCAYRGKDGKQCAGGPLIPDSVYQPEMEGRSWGCLITLYKFHDVSGKLEIGASRTRAPPGTFGRCPE